MHPDARDDSPLGERAQLLLKVLVESYIRDGQPVGSRSLSRDSGLNLSSATVRNVMADLEEGGFVTSPHTSAGRIPTSKGYRFFVDTLLRVRPLEEAAADDIRRQLGRGEDARTLVSAASQLLSDVTHMAGVVTLPSTQAASITQIEFLALSETRERLNAGMVDTISVAQQLLPQQSPTGGREYVMAGETNLMGFAELSSVDKLKRLFEAFNEKRDLLNLLDMSLHGQGVQIFIGQESGYQILDDCSVVTAPYASDTGAVGVIGVIGPTRMAYERVIPVVDLTARVLGAALNSRR